MPLSEFDLTLFCDGSRLVVDVKRLPTLADWREKARDVGLVLREPWPLVETAAPQPVTAKLDVLASAPFDSAGRLSAQGTLPVPAQLALTPIPHGPVIDDEDIPLRERDALRGSRWELEIVLEPKQPDLLPTALAVALAAAGSGVVYHSGLAHSAWGTDARAMLAKLAWYCDHLGALDAAELLQVYPGSVVPAIVDRVTQQVVVPRGPDGLGRTLMNIVVEHYADVESDDSALRVERWAELFLACVHIWLSPVMLEPAVWQEIVGSVRRELEAADPDARS